MSWIAFTTGILTGLILFPVGFLFGVFLLSFHQAMRRSRAERDWRKFSQVMARDWETR